MGRRVTMELTCNNERSYGVCQEHHISVSLLGEIVRQMRSKNWPLLGNVSRDGPLPFYVITTGLANKFALNLVKTYGRLLQETLTYDIAGTFPESQRKFGHVVIDLLRSSYHVTCLKWASPVVWCENFSKGNVGCDMPSSQTKR